MSVVSYLLFVERHHGPGVALAELWWFVGMEMARQAWAEAASSVKTGRPE